MRLNRILLPLSLFVCAAVFAAPPAVTFEADGVYAAVPPGHTVAWSTSGVGSMKAGLVADSDNDGRVKLATTLYRAWAVFDVESAEWATGGAPATDLPPRTIVRSPAGDFSIVYPPYPVNEDYGIPLWVRPGVGAWTLPNGYGPPSTVIWRKNGGILDATQMSPLGNSPATPSEFADGDYLLLVNPLSIAAGLVDPRLDDPPSAGAFFKQSDEYTVPEASTLGVNIVRIGGTTGTVSVRCVLSGTAQAGIDYAVPASTTVTFGPGETVKALSLQLLNDGAFNLDPRQIDVNLTDPTGGATVGGNWPTTITMTDDDPRPIISLGSIPASVPEGDVTWKLDVPIHIANAFRGSLPIALRDHDTVVDQITAGSGQTDVIAKLPIYANDDQSDPDRTYTISITSSYADTTGGTRTITAVDDDPAPVIINDDARAIESDFAYILVRAQWSPATSATVSWKTVDGTAKAGEDYVAAAGTTTISSTSSTIGIALIHDDAAEGPEVFYIDVTGVSGPLLPPTRTRYMLSIIDDDELPSGVTVEPVTVVEGDITKSVPLHVKLASPSQSRIELRIGTTANGTATQFKDYSGGSFVLFQPGETEKDATITVYGEEVGEPDETGEITILDKTFTKVLA
ncbi:MAG TPA: Calx-beta domain-containing protein, partial [Thermoanaerobaculia bacterium]